MAALAISRPFPVSSSCLRQNRIRFPIHFLKQKIEGLARFLATAQKRFTLLHVALETRDLLGDIAALDVKRRFLDQPVWVDLCPAQ